MRRIIALVGVCAVVATTSSVVMMTGAGPARAAVPSSASPTAAPVPASPDPVDQQVRKALTRLKVQSRRPHAGIPENLDHPEADRMGSTTSGRSRATPPRGHRSFEQQASSASAQAGLDVSSYQSSVNWSAVAGAGATFAYAKATEGNYYTSGSYAAQYDGSYAAGLIRGGYHFAIPNNSTGAAQADFFVANGGGWSPDRRTLPGMLDIEYNPYGPSCYGLTQAQMVGWITSFNNEYHLLTTRWPDIYTTTDWWNTCTGNLASFGQASLSIANYSGSPFPLPPGWAIQTFWQWADSGTFPGDQELFNGSHQALVDFAAGSVVTPIAPTIPATFTAALPIRLLDTRTGIGAPAAAVGPGQQVRVQIAGTHGIPRTGVSAVTVNLTVTGPTRSGYLTAYPDGGSRPVVSNLNFSSGQTVADLAVVPVGADGSITLYNGSTGTVQMLADLAGYYVAGRTTVPGAYGALGPVRVLDTRTGIGAPAATVGPGQQVRVQIAGTHGIPRTGVSAVTVNLTVTGSNRSGYLTAYPAGGSRPVVSNLNFSSGQTVADLAVVPVGADGSILLYNGSIGTVQMIADLAGYYVAGQCAAAGTMQTVPPTRILDTRLGLGAPTKALVANGSLSVQVSGTAKIPGSGVSAVIVSVTVVTPTRTGYLTVGPSGNSQPSTSNINFPAGLTVANLVVVPLDPRGRLQLTNSSAGTTDLVVDVAGYYLTGR